MQTVATRAVELTVTSGPTLTDYIKSSVSASGTGSTVSFDLPGDIEADDQIYVFMRYEQWPVQFYDTDNFYHSSGYLTSIETGDPVYPPPYPGLNMDILDRYATSDDAGRTVTFTLKLYDDFGGSVIDDYSGPWQVFCYVLDHTFRTSTLSPGDTDFDRGVEFSEYGADPYAYEGMDIQKTNELVFFVGVSDDTATFAPSESPTELHTASNMYVGAKIYPSVGTLSGITFNCSGGYYIGATFGVYTL